MWFRPKLRLGLRSRLEAPRAFCRLETNLFWEGLARQRIRTVSNSKDLAKTIG